MLDFLDFLPIYFLEYLIVYYFSIAGKTVSWYSWVDNKKIPKKGEIVKKGNFWMSNFNKSKIRLFEYSHSATWGKTFVQN